MLVYVKEDIFIISSNATCSRHNIAEILFIWRQAIITKSLSLQPTRCYNVMGRRVVVFNAFVVYSGVRFFGIFFLSVFVLCLVYPLLLWIVHFFIAPSVFWNVFFSNSLIRSWRTVLLVEETKVRGENLSLYHILLYHRVYQLILVQLMNSLVIWYQLIICWLVTI